jgi:inner membrane protein involved in colicin E2 resistance
MEEARQHTALNGLYWLSLVLFGLSLLALVSTLAFKLQVAAQAFVILAFSALLTRALAYSGASFSLRKTKPSRAILLAVYGLLWSAFAAFFLVFVVLRQFGATS